LEQEASIWTTTAIIGKELICSQVLQEKYNQKKEFKNNIRRTTTVFNLQAVIIRLQIKTISSVFQARFTTDIQVLHFHKDTID
jgi:hypothetical protein